VTSSRSFLGLGLVGSLLVTVALASRDVGPVTAVFAAALLVMLPALAVAQLAIELPEEIDAMSVYLSSAVMVVALALLSIAVGVTTPGLGPMGLGPVALQPLVLGAVVATVAGLAVLVGSRLLARAAGWEESHLVRLVMPATPRERRAFIGVSFAAGFGEEIAYRGFLLAILLETLGDPVSAVIATSIAFGLLHAYQGVIGMVRTGLIGIAFAGIAVALGSVWPVVVGHVIINLVAGLLLGDWLLDTES